jgi:hypothetical protein
VRKKRVARQRRNPIAVYRTDLEIDASAERVWVVLIDFESYPD